MANADVLGSITYEAETAGAFNPATGTGWGEDVNTFATLLVPSVIPVDTSGLVHNKSTAEYTEQYRGAGHRPVLMTMGGSFRMKLDLAGHGSSTNGTPTVNAVETLLNRVTGGTGAFSLATSQTTTGGTASVATASGATGITAGGLVRVGSLGDGDGNGQFYAVASHAASNITFLNDLVAAPANGLVVYPVYQIFSNSSPTASSIDGTRFRLQTANTQYRLHGCFPMSVSISGLSPGERPQIEIEWGVSWWTDTGTDTFPNTVSTERNPPSPVAAGSLHINAVGTSTRATYTCRNFTIEWTLGVEPLRGPGGANPYQDIVGAVRTGNEMVKIGFTVDAEAAGTTTLADWGRSGVDRFIVYTLNPNAGKAVGFKFPKVCSDDVPVQIRDGNINRYRFSGTAYTSDTLTSELTRARCVIGLS
jgi:hypothetical protein